MHEFRSSLTASPRLLQASGAVHEAVLWGAMRERPRCEWLAFFALQGPLVCVEALLCAALRRRQWRARLCRRSDVGAADAAPAPLPVLLTVPLTWALILLPATALFFPPPVRTGLAARVVASLRAAFGT